MHGPCSKGETVTKKIALSVLVVLAILLAASYVTSRIISESAKMLVVVRAKSACKQDFQIPDLDTANALFEYGDMRYSEAPKNCIGKIDDLVGRRLARPVQAGQVLTLEDLAPRNEPETPRGKSSSKGSQ